MHKTSKVAMRRINRKLIKYEGLVQTHCGHQELLDKAFQARDELIDTIREALVCAENECKQPSNLKDAE
jgi:hypothetical protein